MTSVHDPLPLLMPRLFPALLFTVLLGSAAPTLAAERLDIPVAVDSGAIITVETAWPAQAARALVVVVPGTGGVSDPYLNPELHQANYDPDHRGGLTSRLLAAGYAVAYFGQRGYAPLRSCISGSSASERAAAFVAHCLDPKVRAGVDLPTITADTGRVFTALAQHPRTRGLRQIALPYSEGMHHVSAAIGQHAMRPAAIVAVGGPIGSLGAIVPYQLRYEYFANIAGAAFARCPDRALTAEQLFRCAGKWTSPDLLSKMNELMAAPTLTRQQLPLRRETMRAHYRAVSAQFAALAPDAPIGASFEGHFMPVAWSARFPYQQMSAAVSTLDQLGAFDGPVVYLFGTRDHLIPLPTPGACPRRSNGSLPVRCSIRLIDEVGHGLEGDSGLPPGAVLDELVRTVDEVAAAAR